MYFMTIASLQCDQATEMAIHHILNQIHFCIATTQAFTRNVMTHSIVIPYRYWYLSSPITENHGTSFTISNATLPAYPITFCVINYDSHDVYIWKCKKWWLVIQKYAIREMSKSICLPHLKSFLVLMG